MEYFNISMLCIAPIKVFEKYDIKNYNSTSSNKMEFKDYWE